MISQEKRCIYKNNQLGEVICQLRFPEILTVEASIPVEFQETIRQVFPRYAVRKEGPAGKQTNNYQFSTQDGVWRVNLTSKFISLACSRYRCWEEFAKMLDKPLAAFIQIYKPAYFERVGLRYLNFVSRQALELTDTPLRELFTPCYLGLLSEEAVNEAAVTRATVDTELAIRGGCRVKIHAGPGKINRNGQEDPEVKFIFDQDLYMSGNVPVNVSAGALETLHSQAYGIFRYAITDTLHDAMEPENI